MFQQFKNIDTAFQFIRLFSIVFLLGTVCICIYTVFRCTQVLKKGQERVYVLSNSKLLEAMAVERTDSLSVEIKDHVKMFHYYFYTLQPNEDVNKRHVNHALYLSDSSAYKEYRSLVEGGYYTGIISNNIIQEVLDYDSIQVNVSHAPYFFKYFGRLQLSRPTSILTRSIITEGYIRMLPAVSEENPHGMLVEQWKIDENRDLTLEKR
jgi:conjugative transposon TraK protein